MLDYDTFAVNFTPAVQDVRGNILQICSTNPTLLQLLHAGLASCTESAASTVLDNDVLSKHVLLQCQFGETAGSCNTFSWISTTGQTPLNISLVLQHHKHSKELMRQFGRLMVRMVPVSFVFGGGVELFMIKTVRKHLCFSCTV